MAHAGAGRSELAEVIEHQPGNHHVRARNRGGDPLSPGSVLAPGLPPIVSFSVTPAFILPGQSATLTWTTFDALDISIGGLGTVSASGTLDVTPEASITYVLSATGPGGTQHTEAAVAVTPLAHWFINGFGGKKVVVWGNSTVSNATTFFYELAKYCSPGQALDGMSCAPVTHDQYGLPATLGDISNFGNNGGTLEALLAGRGPYPIESVCNAKPDLLVMRGPLINDVRLGQCDLTCATEREQEALDRLEQCTPETSILLTTENSLLTTDPGNYQWVKPQTAEAVQAYTDIIRHAMLAMTGRYPNVQVYDVMAEEYGTISPATSPLMANQLHPNGAGQKDEAKLILAIIGKQ